MGDLFFILKTTLTFYIYNSVGELPAEWDNLAHENIFLTSRYLQVLEESAPENMICSFIGFFDNKKLVGVAIAQFLNINQLESFGDRDRCVKTTVRNFIFRNFSSHVLFIGNNMLTGQNAFIFSDEINPTEALQCLKKAISSLKKLYQSKGFSVHLTSVKDFEKDEIRQIKNSGFQQYFKFSTQPNMVLEIKNNWKSIDDYTGDLLKKYRDQYKRARKKSEGVDKRRLNLSEIKKYETKIYNLYHHVAQNAPFNTFFLAKNHFSKMKELLQDDFLLYGYFDNNELIGFNTLIKNGCTMDTYFLGYDNEIQKEKMLYLNMLYDMIAYSIKKNYKEIIFARTALEIKSSVGAKPIEVFGFLEHNNRFINKNIDKIFKYLEPKTDWIERNPFKN